MQRACVYATADDTTRRLVEQADVLEGARAIGITLGAPGPSELGIVDGMLIDRAFLADRHRQALQLTEPGDLDHLGPHGAPPHILLDALAAAALARAHGVEPAAVQAGLRAYRIAQHRAEHLATIDGVHWIDDTKATNPAAARASLAASDQIVWIAGGDLKGADVDELVSAVAPRLIGAILLGVDTTAFEQALSRHAPTLPVIRVDQGQTGDVENRTRLMRDAVQAAHELAVPGSTVLLAPAAASVDQFRDYAERGDLFAAAVTELPGERA